MDAKNHCCVTNQECLISKFPKFSVYLLFVTVMSSIVLFFWLIWLYKLMFVTNGDEVINGISCY